MLFPKSKLFRWGLSVLCNSMLSILPVLANEDPFANNNYIPQPHLMSCIPTCMVNIEMIYGDLTPDSLSVSKWKLLQYETTMRFFEETEDICGITASNINQFLKECGFKSRKINPAYLDAVFMNNLLVIVISNRSYDSNIGNAHAVVGYGVSDNRVQCFDFWERKEVQLPLKDILMCYVILK